MIFIYWLFMVSEIRSNIRNLTENAKKYILTPSPEKKKNLIIDNITYYKND